MKHFLSIFLILLAFASCKKNSGSPAYSVQTAMDTLGLQFGKQYAYKHYTDSVLYETGYVTFNSDTSFVEIMNSDTFYFHARIIYTYDPNSTNINIPNADTVQGNANGLRYTYYLKINSSALLFFSDPYIAWCCYSNDSVKGNAAHYLPLAYYLKHSAPVFMGRNSLHTIIAPPAGLDSAGFPIYNNDKIIIEN